MSEDEKEDSLDRELDELKEELDEENKEYELLEEEPQEDTPQEKETDTEESEEMKGESIAEFLAREDEDMIREKKLKILNGILKEQEDSEFFQFLHEHRELENLLKMFVFALTQLTDGTVNVNKCIATAKREADIVKVEYEFFDKEGNRVYFEQDGTVSKVFSSEREKP